jgi:FdhD protein
MKIRKYSAVKLTSSHADEVSDSLTLEHPLSIAINGTAFTLTMHTPGDEENLARGLLFSEGVYKNKKLHPQFEIIEKSEEGFISSMNVLISENEIDKSQLNKRNLLSVASCGICGKTELLLPEGSSLTATGQLRLENIQNMFVDMNEKQRAFIDSGGCHAASAFSKEFQLLSLKEDIGRHNAVDKVIGALLQREELSKANFLLVSGRVSYEIITKCFIAGIPFLLAVSAPSSLAVDFAKELGITLIGFCREDRATVYSNVERVLFKSN